MAISDKPTWTAAGVFLGMVATALVNTKYVLLGAILGGFIGYLFAKNVR